MVNKSTRFEVQARVEKVFEYIVTGMKPADICQYASEEWGVSDRQAFRYMADANQKIIESSDINRNRELGLALSRLNLLFKNAFKLQDYKTCLQVQREINTLLGLYAPAQSTLRIDDWRSQAIEDIRRGAITYDALAQAFDDTLAAELFRPAGVEVSDDADRA